MISDLMSAFVMVMRAHPKDGDVTEAACFMFSTVAKDKDNKQVGRAASELENPPCFDTSHLLIHALKQGFWQVSESVVKSGAPLLIVMVLRHFSQLPVGNGELEGVLRRAVEALGVVGLEEASTAGAVKLAGAPAALQTIIEKYPGGALSASAASILDVINPRD